MSKTVDYVDSLLDKASKAPNSGDAFAYAEAAKSAAEALAVLSQAKLLGSLPK